LAGVNYFYLLDSDFFSVESYLAFEQLYPGLKMGKGRQFPPPPTTHPHQKAGSTPLQNIEDPPPPRRDATPACKFERKVYSFHFNVQLNNPTELTALAVV